MAMDAKALLDSLMGTGRDKAKSEKRDDEWKDEKVCKYFLLKFCPTNENDNWFHNTKIGPVGEVCKKIHSEALQREFEKHKDKDRYERKYEAELYKYLKGLIANADARVAREQANCKEANAKTKSVVKMPGSMQWQYDQMVADRRHALNDAAMLERGGQGEAAKGPVERAAQLDKDIKKLEEEYTVESKGDIVCEICGVRCSMDDARSYDGHVTSNLHSAYSRIRDKYKELTERKVKEDPGDEDDRNRDEKDSGARERRNDKDRSRKDRSRSGDRDRDRGRGDRRDDRKDRDRNGDRDRGRGDRDRDRGDRDRGRRRSRSR